MIINPAKEEEGVVPQDNHVDWFSVDDVQSVSVTTGTMIMTDPTSCSIGIGMMGKWIYPSCMTGPILNLYTTQMMSMKILRWLWYSRNNNNDNIQPSTTTQRRL